jgi:hypothetical protein
MLAPRPPPTAAVRAWPERAFLTCATSGSVSASGAIQRSDGTGIQTVARISDLRQTARYLSPDSAARQRLACAREVLPDGITRETIRRAPWAPYMARAHGTALVDLDGDERTDFLFNHTSLIHGHTYGPVVAAISGQARTLEAIPFPSEREAELARPLTAAPMPVSQSANYRDPRATLMVQRCLPADRAPARAAVLAACHPAAPAPDRWHPGEQTERVRRWAVTLKSGAARECAYAYRPAPAGPAPACHRAHSDGLTRRARPVTNVSACG